MPKLILTFKGKILEAYRLTRGEKITIGRNQGNTIFIDNLAVSGSHAELTLDGSVLRVADLGSKNGTFVNDEKIAESTLGHKDKITIGKHVLLIDLDDEIDAPQVHEPSRQKAFMTTSMNNHQTMSLDTPRARQLRGEELLPAAPAHPDVDTLCVLAGAEGAYKLSQSKNFSIGRNSDADIVVGGFWRLLMGSPAATIRKQAGDYFLRFAGGLIKPKRNGAGVKGTVKLNHDDVVSIGPVQLQIQLK